MDPNTYRTPKNYNSTEEWFNTIAEPIPPIETSSKRSNKKVVIMILVVLVLVIGSVATVFGIDYFSRGVCLTDEDYAIFTGAKPDAQLSPQNFYTQSVEFSYATNDYTDASAKSAHELINKVAALYREHGDDRSIIITLNSDYLNKDTRQMADARIDKLKSALIDADVETSAIYATEPTDLYVTGDLAEEFERPTTALAYVSVASSVDCR